MLILNWFFNSSSETREPLPLANKGLVKVMNELHAYSKTIKHLASFTRIGFEYRS